MILNLIQVITGNMCVMEGGGRGEGGVGWLSKDLSVDSTMCIGTEWKYITRLLHASKCTRV